MPTSEQFTKMLQIYGYASQAFWRTFEVDQLSQLTMERPILEIGCADGEFTRAVCERVEVGVDINPNAVARARRNGVFEEVLLQDAHDLNHANKFRTVLANSVLEHIPDLQPVLAGSYRALESGGRLILTVPLSDMNRNLFFAAPGWIRFRQDRLCHVNLWPLEHWVESLERAGFESVTCERFLTQRQMRLWDAMDGVAVLGTRRINIGSATKKITRSLPTILQNAIYAVYSWFLSGRLADDDTQGGCCALIVATR